ncbi:MAG: carboxyl transferase domain-containing protein [Desulfobacterales bacterium]
MNTIKNAVEDLKRRRAEALEMGGEKRIKRQHDRGKMTVRERVAFLMDAGSFQEYGMLASHAFHKPGDKVTPADGIVTGFGKIDGRNTGVIAEDFTIHGGSVGGVNMLKRFRMIDIATRERVPLVYLFDGGGARAQMLGQMPEGLPMAGQYIKMAKMTGIAPQVGVVMGACAGESSLEASMLEFLIMVRDTGMLAAGGPPVVKASLGLTIEKKELGGSEIHCTITGLADNPAESDEDAMRMARKYLSYLPANAFEYPPYHEPDDDPDRKEEELLEILPDKFRSPYDMKRIIQCIVDQGSFFEIQPEFAPMMIVGLCRMNGHPVGVVANQPTVSAGAITAKAAQKERKFIDLCSAYHIPLLFLVDTPGVMTGPEAEKEGSLKFGLPVAYALAWADVPIFTVVVRKAFGFGGCAMSGYMMGQTLTLAWPTVDFSSLPADSAVFIVHQEELAAAEDPDALFKQLLKVYSAYAGPYPAAGIFNVDDVIDPRETRPRLIRALELALNRRSARPAPVMRHGVMPG